MVHASTGWQFWNHVQSSYISSYIHHSTTIKCYPCIVVEKESIVISNPKTSAKSESDQTYGFADIGYHIPLFVCRGDGSEVGINLAPHPLHYNHQCSYHYCADGQAYKGVYQVGRQVKFFLLWQNLLYQWHRKWAGYEADVVTDSIASLVWEHEEEVVERFYEGAVRTAVPLAALQAIRQGRYPSHHCKKGGVQHCTACQLYGVSCLQLTLPCPTQPRPLFLRMILSFRSGGLTGYLTVRQWGRQE